MSYTPRHYGWPWSPSGTPLPDEGTAEPQQQAAQPAEPPRRLCSLCGGPIVLGYCRCT